ncbi:hypothetical protein SDC9_125879 [bioreactor metagenome]|uniref:Uncharacterized protein n=1 Tax=bioreactor metagenome TaxID=1076179 RepID=A0A645CPR4_9ZZZZ
MKGDNSMSTDDHTKSIEASEAAQVFLQLDEETQKELICLLRFLSSLG